MAITSQYREMNELPRVAVYTIAQVKPRGKEAYVELKGHTLEREAGARRKYALNKVE